MGFVGEGGGGGGRGDGDQIICGGSNMYLQLKRTPGSEPFHAHYMERRSRVDDFIFPVFACISYIYIYFKVQYKILEFVYN